MIDLKKIFSNKPFALNEIKKKPLFFKNQKQLSEYHYKNCPEYKNICDNMFKKINKCISLEELPFIHVKVFKELNLKSIDKKNLSKTLHSSGTSGKAKSKINIDRNTSLLQSKALINIFSSIIKKKTTFFFIEDSIGENLNSISASIAAIRGFSQMSKETIFIFKKNKLEINPLIDFIKKNPQEKFVIFGFTNNIWTNLVKKLKQKKINLSKNNGILIHGGGWKKLENSSISKVEFNKNIKKTVGVKKVHNYYGMVEQTGSVFLECEKGFFHCSLFSQIFIRNMNLSIAKKGEIGLIQTLSLLQLSYPGHNILTEDLGRIEGVDNCKCGRKGKYFSVLGRVPGTEKRGCSDA
mgnify:CR=1 FL=1